jgi:hypothetical protein
MGRVMSYLMMRIDNVQDFRTWIEYLTPTCHIICSRFTFDSPSARLRASCKKRASETRYIPLRSSISSSSPSVQTTLCRYPSAAGFSLFSHTDECIARVWPLKRCANLFLLKLAESLSLMRISVLFNFCLYLPIFSCPSYLWTSRSRLATCTPTERKAYHTITPNPYVILLYFNPPMLSHPNPFHTIPYLTMADT